MTLEQKIRTAIPELGNDEPIQLNHVLEYVKKVSSKFNNESYLSVVNNWNLKSNLLSDQSPELKIFINELA